MGDTRAQTLRSGMPARVDNGVPRWVSAVFFVSFIVVGVWLGMSLWVTVVFETYKQQHRAKIARAGRVGDSAITSPHEINPLPRPPSLAHLSRAWAFAHTTLPRPA